ncbi:trans-sialidase, partial [Trypanosoma cruzi]
MSRHVFTFAVLLLLVVMMCDTGRAAQAGVEEQSSGPTFQWKAITGGVTVDSLDVPGLLKVGSDVFAVAEAQCKKGGDSFTGIASQLLTMDKGNEPEEVLKDAKDTQFLEEVTSPEGKKRVGVSRPTTAVKGSDIYMLVGKYNRNDAQDSGEGDLGLLLVKGEVGEGSNNQIRWKTTDGVPCTLGEEHKSLTRLIGGGGSGVKLKDGTLLFPVEGIKKEREGTGMDGKAVSLILYSSDTPSCTLSKEVPDGGCSDPSVVEWKGKLMMMTACDDGRRRVYESGDKGDSWTEALGTLSRVWGNRRDGDKANGVGSGFITATIENRDVMLVTLPVYSKEKGVLHLWLTDNTHIVDIGPVSGDD